MDTFGNADPLSNGIHVRGEEDMLPGGSVGRTRQVHSSSTDKPFPACLLYHAEFNVTGAISISLMHQVATALLV